MKLNLGFLLLSKLSGTHTLCQKPLITYFRTDINYNRYIITDMSLAQFVRPVATGCGLKNLT